MRNACLILCLSSLIQTLAPAQWVNTNCPEGGGISLAVSGATIIVGKYGNGMVRSTDNGNSWVPADPVPFERFVYRLGARGDQFFAGTDTSFLVSSNRGESWNRIEASRQALSFLTWGDTIIAGVGFGQSRSTDAGATWNYTAFSPSNNLYSLATDGHIVYAGTYWGLFTSSDFGASWQQAGFVDTTVWSVACSQGNVLVSTCRIDGMGRSGGYYSTDGGRTWARNDTLNATVLYARENVVWSVIYDGFVGVSMDGGITWRDITDGLQTANYDIATNDSYAFVATAFGVYRRPLSEILASVSRLPAAAIPTQLALAQNYPNPFNPTTTIEFSVPKAGFVSLKVFNIIGEEVATLISQEIRAGTFSTQWDASHVASGVYFYRLQTGADVVTRKLILAR